MSRSLNKVILIGNLTRDPELRYTPQGTAVCSFGMATNRQWVTDGEKKEEATFHNIVAWANLAEVAAKYLSKGRQAYVEGRLSTRDWETQTGEKRRTTEIIASDIIFLSGGPIQPAAPEVDMGEASAPEAASVEEPPTKKPTAKAPSQPTQLNPEEQEDATAKKTRKSPKATPSPAQETTPPEDEDDIPF